MSTAVFQKIAAEVGVSPRTVQRVLNGGLRDTRPSIVARAQRVRELARKLDYRPNAAAKATATGRFGAISLLLSTGYGRSSVPTDLFNTLLDLLAHRDMALMAVRLPDERLTDDRFVPRILRETSSDGLLIDYTHGIPQKLIDLIHSHRIPAVWLNTTLEHNCVRPDDYAAAVTATEHLLQLGHRRITYLDYSHGHGFPDPHYSVAARENGYRHAMAAAGLTPVVDRRDGRDVPWETRYAFSLRWLDRPDLPTAVVAHSSSTSNPLMTAALARGVKTPGDLSIITFENSVVRFADEPVTTLVLQQPTIAARAIDLLLDHIADRDTTVPCVVVPFVLEPGASTGPPRPAQINPVN